MHGYQSWIDKQIAQAESEGKFDDLPSKGKPLDLSDDDELWWVKKLMKREGLSYLPPTLRLRKDAELTLTAINEMENEQDVREALQELNERIAETIRTPQSGPPLGMSRLDPEVIVRRWRSAQGG